MIKRKILLLCGPSGAGKTWKEKELVDLSPIGDYTFKKLEQVTTRKKRNDEDPYTFISVEQYKKLEDKLIAKTQIPTDDGEINYYGTIPYLLEDEKVIHTVIVNRKGIDDICEYIGNNPELNIQFTIIMIDSMNPVTRSNRGEAFVNAERESLKDIYDFILLNDHDNESFISVDDIYECLKITGMVTDNE